ncbi:hypothetical protein [Streptomyces pseudovenezuelae]|uniref:Uncharacterized protein n=1 Tax=Streptomyces pseudovenezuelae TaxID=67350 RepID=A0ABT6M1J6_9ACTN|nr:hypothetical protein [Streptomyces pseudovenezuelae]MDH6222429.1 hypothetical protein [Streptomyces pseudovenezuelae]
MYERKTQAPPRKPAVPGGTIAAHRPPHDVRIGDFVHLDGAYHQIQDMRSAGDTSRRVLLFAEHSPLTMTEAMTIHRPVGTC